MDAQYSAVQEGTVNWFNSAKGYGFITRKDGASDIFVHYSAIVATGYKTLHPGDGVRFIPVEGSKAGRLQASQVEVTTHASQSDSKKSSRPSR